MSKSSKIPFLIVGGGIGGLATALAIAKTGRPVHVIEKAAQFAEIGAGLQLAPNATRTLDRLGVWEEIRKRAVFPKRLVMMDAVSGEHITSLDLGRKFVERYGYPYVVMHRGDLLGVELQACQANSLITLESSKEVVSVEDLGEGVRVSCADDSVYECDALVGADGLWSTIRKVIHDDGDPMCSAFVAYRGAIPMAEVPDNASLDNVTIWCGPDLHFVQYTIQRDTTFNQVAVFRSDLYKPGHDSLDDWGTMDELDEHFAKMCSQVQAGIKKIKRNRRWPMFDRLPIPNWTRNRITLLGDAAHPMLQYLAQGACQALEDALYLGDMLQRHGADLARAFVAYQEGRIGRTGAMQTKARLFGDMLHVKGGGRLLRKALLAKRAPDDFDCLDWFYGYKASLEDEPAPAAVGLGAAAA